MSVTIVDIETSGDTPWQGDLVALGIGHKVFRPEEGMRAFEELVQEDPCTIVAHTNYDLRWLILNGASFPEHVQFHDTKVMAFMLDQQSELGLDKLCQRYLGVEPLSKPIKQVKGRIMFKSELAGLIPIEDVPWEEMEEYNRQDLDMTAALYMYLRRLLKEKGFWDRYFIAEEAPLSRLLIEMEAAGMPIDEDGTREFLDKADEERQRLYKQLVADTGVVGFNLKSGDQVASFIYDEMPTFKVKAEIPGLGQVKAKDLREVLAREFLPTSVNIERIGTKFVYGTQTVQGLGLTPPKMKKKRGVEPKRPPIDAENLVLLHGEHRWVEKYLRWNSLNTLVSRYLESWVEMMHEGRLHGRYDQARAETGRIASRDPNLQAIPVSMDFNVRVLFRAPLVIGDYSGLDARVAAHFSEDPLMLEIYQKNLDLYGTLASNAWGGPPTKKNENRGLMKILMLSAQYGAQAGSVGDKMRIAGFEEKLCKQSGKLLRNMEETLGRMFEWREEVLREAMANGYVCTITGRRRFLPDLYSDEWWKRTRAERQCVASMVQGTSADIVRRAMVKVRREVDPEAAKIVLQVHDEILWERGPAWTDEVFDQIVEICQTAHEEDFYVPETGEYLPGFPMLIPMQFQAGLGEDWNEKDAQGARSYRVMSKGVVEEVV